MQKNRKYELSHMGNTYTLKGVKPKSFFVALRGVFVVAVFLSAPLWARQYEIARLSAQ